MVNYYFDDIGRQKELKAAMDEWLNTPFKHRMAVKGRGCDCIHFVGGVLEEIGLLPFSRIDIPDYPKDWHLHNTRELLSESIKEYLDVDEKVMPCPLSNGDIILSHYGKAASHAGIFFNDYVYQSLTGLGVKKIHINEKKLKDQMKFILRVKGSK